MALGQPLQGRCTFPHLGYRAWGTAEVGIVEGLDAVDHGHRRSEGLQLLENPIEIGFRQQLKAPPGRGSPIGERVLQEGRAHQPAPAQAHLLGRLLRADVQHAAVAGHRLGHLEEQGGLADPRIPAQKHEGPWHQAAPQHPIQLAEPGVQAGQGWGALVLDGGGAPGSRWIPPVVGERIVAVTAAVDAVVYPFESRISMIGVVVITAPEAPATGCRVIASWAAGPGVTKLKFRVTELAPT